MKPAFTAATGLVSGVLMAIPALPLMASATEPADVTSVVPPGVEAADVAEALEPVGVDDDNLALASYEVRFGSRDDLDADGALTTRFPLPDGCSPGAQGGVLSCDTGPVLVEPVALTLEGEPVPYEATVNGTDVEVAVKPGARASEGYVLTAFAAPLSERGALLTASDTFTWMVASDVEETEGTMTWDDEEEEGEWFEEDSDEEAGPDETGEAWEPAADEFETPPKFNPGQPIDAYAGFKRPKQVTVPSNYVYCKVWVTSRCRPKNLHDYCSWSPDTFAYTAGRAVLATVSFKGPCARHDLAIDSIRKKNITLTSKRSQRANADTTFRNNLRQNCGYSLYKHKTGRVKCYDRAAVYYSVVSKRTVKWDGK
ncbi:phospholipase A2 [Sediminivirga luteola]|uniref:phospholipase A2 n=1 Tax=Sediminivirga luteola TaxID=1774748 RepID=UPI001F581C92|nr:phospholipase A2 [Sediminivirga luteola]MCI2266676.1 phospholipase [Sediminivirga luteola]